MEPKTDRKTRVWPLGSFALLAIVVMAFPLFTTTAAAADTPEVVGEHLGLKPGDIFEYDLDMSGMIDVLIAESGSTSATTKDISSSYKETIDMTEKVQVAGVEVDSYVITKEMKYGFTIVDAEQEVESKISSTTITRVWMSKETFRPVKVEEDEDSTYTIVQGSGLYKSTSTIETQKDTKFIFGKINETCAYPMTEGKEWTTSEQYTVDTTEKSRFKGNDDPYSDWQTSTYSNEVIEEIENSIGMIEEVTTSAGSFDAFKVSSSNVSGPLREISYVDENGMIVRMDRYESGAPCFIMTLRSFKYQNAIDSDHDGTVDVQDKFPQDAAASVDADGDGHPDAWNAGKTEADSTTDLSLDKYPQDPLKWEAPKDSPFGFGIAVLCLVITAFLVIIGRGRAN